MTVRPIKINGKYHLKLVEHPKTISHIDKVSLLATMKNGNIINLPLTFANHSREGNVFNSLLKSDDLRIDTFGLVHLDGEDDYINLGFAGLENANIESFTFVIEGYNEIIK